MITGCSATDPDRAERIASSITDESAKAEALHKVAHVLAAATDPGRAERLFTDAERTASSITNEYVKAAVSTPTPHSLWTVYASYGATGR
jgi:hypothetical protein